MRVRYPSFIAVCLTSAWLTACAGSPSTPSDSPTARMLEGQTVSAIDGSASGGISVRVGSARAVYTDSSGYFSVDVGGAGSFATTASGTAIVERRTLLDGPTSERTRLSLIPSSFDLAAFDQMFRTANSRLQRWMSRPSLVILASVMSYRGNSGMEYSATAEQMSDAEVALLAQHLTEGLSLLTGGAYTAFASVDVERPESGARVNVGRSGKIVVGRYNGVVSIASTIGFGTWQEQPDGTVTGGTTFLDTDFDRTDNRRRLLRIHELGHALGYLHVTTRSSIMNPSIGPEPTEFDRAGAIIAFQRQPGNTSPDIDPAPTSRGFSAGAGRWVDPACRVAR